MQVVAYADIDWTEVLCLKHAKERTNKFRGETDENGIVKHWWLSPLNGEVETPEELSCDVCSGAVAQHYERRLQ